MARSLLGRGLVRILALVIALTVALAVGAARPAGADEVEDHAAKVVALEQRLGTLDGERRGLAQAYDQKAAAVAQLKAQPSAWGRDRKLQALLADSQDMAAALDRKDAELRGATAALGVEKKALLGAIDAELGATAAPTAERRALLESRRAALVAKAARPIRIPDERIDPADDAEDLELKAGALARSEDALAAETQLLERRAVYFRRQAKLARSRARAEEDVFREEEARLPGRPVTTGRPDQSPSVGPVTSSPGSGTSFDGRGLDLAADPSIVLADVVASSTLDELRRAERSGDPETLARSAERATREVAERADKVRQRRLEMLRRAQKLRGEIP